MASSLQESRFPPETGGRKGSMPLQHTCACVCRVRLATRTGAHLEWHVLKFFRTRSPEDWSFLLLPPSISCLVLLVLALNCDRCTELQRPQIISRAKQVAFDVPFPRDSLLVQSFHVVSGRYSSEEFPFPRRNMETRGQEMLVRLGLICVHTRQKNTTNMSLLPIPMNSSLITRNVSNFLDHRRRV